MGLLAIKNLRKYSHSKSMEGRKPKAEDGAKVLARFFRAPDDTIYVEARGPHVQAVGPGDPHSLTSAHAGSFSYQEARRQHSPS